MITTISYILLAIVVYSGITIGYLLSIWLKKETKEYKRSFSIISKMVLALVIPLWIYFMNPFLIFTAISAYLLLLALLLMIRPKSTYTYPFLGLIFFWSSFSKELIIIQSIVLFLYGIASNPVELKKKRKDNYLRILYNLSFLVTALVPLTLKAFF